MYVVKRDGRQESVHFDKITARLKKLSYGLSIDHCDPVLVAQKVCAGVYKGVTTSQLDELAAETAAAMTANHPDYASVSISFFTLMVVKVCLLWFCWFVIVWCSWLLGLLSRICTRILGSRFPRRECFFLTFSWSLGFEESLLLIIVWLIGFRIKDMYGHFNVRSGLKAPLIADDVYEIIMKVLSDQIKILF